MSTNFDQNDSRQAVQRKKKWRTLRTKWQKAWKLNALDKQGVAFVLTLAIGIAGVSAAWFTGQRLQDEEPQQAQLPPQVEQTVPQTSEDIVVETFEESLYTNPEEEQQPQQTQEVPAAATPTVDEVLADLTTPVQGEVVNEFSIDTLKYNETLGQWCTHSGVDYAAKEGTPVTAALEGTVESVVHDPLMGLTVTLSHECGVKTVYAGLADTAQVVAEGVHIASGETIGSVGTSAAFEAHLGAHLHFEVITPDGFADIPD